jgi:hypothetical protein
MSMPMTLGDVGIVDEALNDKRAPPSRDTRD